MANLQVEAVLRDKTKAGLSQLQRQIERAHNKANALRNRERAAVEKAHTRSNTLISKQSVAVEKAHNRANTLRQKEQIAVEKAHLRANKMREQEKAQLDANTRRMGLYGAAVAGAVVAMGAKALSAFQSFQASMNQVKAVSGATADEMLRLKDLALEMGSTTKFSAKEAADAMGFLAMAGLSVNEVATALPGTLELAAAGNLDLAEAADLATNVMSGMGLEVKDLGRLNDVLATAAASSNTSVSQLGSAMKFVAPVAAAAGMSVEQTAAAIGVLSNAGIQGELAGTALRGSITKLLNPSAQAEKILDKLGVTVTNTAGDMLPLDKIVQQFEQSGLSAGDAMAIFGQRAGPGMLALVSAGSKGLTEYTKELENAEGAAAKMAETQQEGLVGSMTRLSSAVDTLMIRFGEQLAPTVGMLVDRFVGFVSWLTESETRINAVAGILAGVFVAGVGLAVAAVWTFVPAITAATGGLNLIIPIIALVVGGIVTWREEIGAFLGGAWAKLKRAVGGAVSWMSPLIQLFGHTSEEVAKLSDELAGHSLTTALNDTDEAAQAFSRTIEAQSAKLVHWGLDIRNIGTQVEMIAPPFHDLTGTIEGQSAALDHWGLDISNVGTQLDTLPDSLDDTEQSAGKLNVTLAAMAGQMGGASGQSLNLVSSMIQTNKNLKEGEEGFSRIEVGAATAGAAFHMLGDAIGGTAGEILSSVGDIATAFATGGPVAAAIAGVGALIKGLKSLFGPSEAELEAREMFAGFHKGVVETIGGTQVYLDEVQRAIDDGWDRTLAETRAGFILWGTEAGLTYDEAFADYARYEQAVRDGNTELMNQIEADYARYQAASEDVTTQVVADADEIADRFAHMSAEEVFELREALRAIKPVAVDTFRGIRSSSLGAGVALNSFLTQILAVNSAIAAMPRHVTTRITTLHETVYSSSGAPPERRQHGGPVSAGRPYMVGEAGPELFVPRRAGSVVANQDMQRPVVIQNIVPIDDITEQVIRRTADKEAEIGFDV